MDSQFLVVNYHYIDDTENGYKYPGIYPVSTKRFRAQMEVLSKTFEFIGQDDLLKLIGKEKSLSGKKCLITFDDGLACQYEKALPILNEFKIPAIFFAVGMPYETGKVLLAHKIQWCQAHISPSEFFQKVAKEYEKITKQVFNFEAFKISDDLIKKQYKFGDLEVSRLKFVLNHYLDNQICEQIIDPIFEKLAGGQRDFLNSFYLNEKQIKDLNRLNYLGVHGYSHKSFSYMETADIEEDVKRCLNVLRQIAGSSANLSSISYPRGGVPVNDLSPFVSLLKNSGLKMGFTTKRGFNQNLREPFFISRFDVNDIPEGKKPLFRLKGNDIEIINEQAKGN